MPAVAENAVEVAPEHLAEERFIHVNLELSDRCGYSHAGACGQDCILAMRGIPEGRVLPSSTTLRAALETIACGKSVRHLALCGREPLAEPDLMKAITQAYHATPSESRPQYIGVISSAPELIETADYLIEHPLSWLITSVDDPQVSGLRTPSAGARCVRACRRLASRGGASALAVNTIFTPGAERRVADLGRWLADQGIRQWYVAPKMAVQGGIIRPVADDAQMHTLAHALDVALAGSEMGVYVHVDAPGVMAQMPQGDLERAIETKRWRIEVPLSEGPVRLAAIAPWIRFWRMRWDGGISAYTDKYARFTAPEDLAYGAYRPGRIREILEQIANDASMPESMMRSAA